MAFPQKPGPTEVLNALLASSSVSELEIRRVFRTVLEQMLLLYYPPFRAQDEDELLSMAVVAVRAYVEDLAPVEPEVLADGWKTVRARHKTQGWPTLGTILDACSVPLTRNEIVDRHKAEKANIEDLLNRVLWNGDLGRQAAEEGWADSLRIFLTEEARQPEPSEVDKMRRGPAEADACMADIERRHKAGEEIVGIDRLRNIHQTMLLRNANLAERILKGRAA